MPKKQKKAALPVASSSSSLPTYDIEVYTTKLWTVTKEGDLMMPVASPPASHEESFGPFWDVRACGDHGGPPASKVRICVV